MNQWDCAEKLTEILEGTRHVYMWTEPEVVDFTAHSKGKVCIQSVRGKVELELARETLWTTLGLLSATVFSKDYVDLLLTWNFKSLCSYFRFYGSKRVVPENSLLDLSPIENFLGVNKKRPENIGEAVNRMKVVQASKGWMPIYKTIHHPLMLKVLPSLETTPLLNEVTKSSQYAYYEIEGQTFGRLNCLKKFKQSYLPTTLGKETRQVLKPLGHKKRFLAADFRACEVCVLQWLSQDAKLKEVIDSGEDLHSEIFRIVTEAPCDTEDKRERSKKMFLSVIYGSGPDGLAKNLGISSGVAKELIRRMRYHFATAFEWLDTKEKEAKKNGVVEDFVGRPRRFKEDDAYRVRDMMVQSTAATVCQEKLVALYNALEGKDTQLCFVVHDGYYMVCSVKDARDSYLLVKQILESESKLCPGLTMKVKIKFGAKLEPMKVLWRD